MKSVKSNEWKTYTQAVQEGKYDLYVGNLFGKYDNVRTYWEDQLTRIVLRPFLKNLTENKRSQEQGVRIVDLGCGAGQGYDILTKIDYRDLDLGLQHKRVLPYEDISLFLGLDISQAMVEKGKSLFGEQAKVQFQEADLSQGLGEIKNTESAFDLYFSSYGSLSHLARKDLVTLLEDVCHHGNNGSLVVMDLIGRYSIEWPDFWHAQSEEEKVREYNMGYLYSESVRKTTDIESFPLRFWTGEEVRELAQEITTKTGVKLEVVKLVDRSILVGRHTDTRSFNPQLKPTRRLINCLHEDYMRTNLDELILDASIFPEHRFITPLLKDLIKSWNILIEFTQHRLTHNFSLPDVTGWDEFPKPLQFALMTIDRVIADVGWMWYGDPRANIIEPQLGYALRTLEYEMQRGWGCGHGLIVVMKIQKD
ncbi:MAG TPA: class I SAM-dependent methyltransferase [Cyanothece sp. UBA12306]|nr:class I SAM-dependent methyltransferase [Cyanothece sp. UBA12306]